MRTLLILALCLIMVVVVAIAAVSWRSNFAGKGDSGGQRAASVSGKSDKRRSQVLFDDYQPSKQLDSAGFMLVTTTIPTWKPDASLTEIGDIWRRAGFRKIEQLDKQLAMPGNSPGNRCGTLMMKAALLNYEGDPKLAYKTLEECRSIAEGDKNLAREVLASVIVFQGLTALRIGENENCILCRGESSCILPISPAARHTKPYGSRLAIKHFTEYLDAFPDDLEIRWLLNLAHMTLGEHPQLVEPRQLITLDKFNKSEFDIGKFRDIGHLVGINRLNQAGGAILEDFDNDGLLDFAITTFDMTEAMAFFRNNGEGKFEDQTSKAKLQEQLGGLNCVQTDYNNDGFKDIFIVRGAWISTPVRPSLLRNNQDGTFTDVTQEAGLLTAVNSISSSWADYDNDGWLDLFICCEKQPSLLYHNERNGKFKEVAEEAGIPMNQADCKGSAWIDYDNDGYRDLFLNYLTRNKRTKLLHNDRNGTFSDVTSSLGIDGPAFGFSCWAWDYDNDGWEDLLATSYDRSLRDVVLGMQGQPHQRESNRLYRNLQGKGFEDVTKEAGLDMVFVAMGSNFGDFDNDGFLDIYLGTGDPNLSMLVPNRMFKNVAGKRFAEITASSGTGNLQKGHGVACGDWDRDGNVDIFIEMGGAINGDKYHNILFQNPGHTNHWLTVKLAGEKSNRAAIGARIKVVTAGEKPLTIHRTVSSGSSFGANPLQQTIGVGKADRIALLEIHWPTSGTTQVFRDVAVDQALEITEFAENYRKLDWKPVPLPKE
ncbi:MAG: CRTAC1 family protein [Planctomycetales bacterium]|nr:CRTAC1 family protein [Planctomycetales bacterium]